MLITDAIQALKAGNELKNPAAWKKGQNLTNTVITLLTAVVGILRSTGNELPVTDEQLIAIAGVIAGILYTINTFITTASTKKIGV